MLANVTDHQVYYAAWCIFGCIATISFAIAIVFAAKYEWTARKNNDVPPK